MDTPDHDMEQYLALRAARRKHIKWRRRVIARLPELANRVWRLRGQPYTGAGFHWAMERTLGNVIAMVSNFDNVPRDVGEMIVEEVIVEGLFQDLVKAEMSLVPKEA